MADLKGALDFIYTKSSYSTNRLVDFLISCEEREGCEWFCHSRYSIITSNTLRTLSPGCLPARCWLRPAPVPAPRLRPAPGPGAATCRGRGRGRAVRGRHPQHDGRVLRHGQRGLLRGRPGELWLVESWHQWSGHLWLVQECYTYYETVCENVASQRCRPRWAVIGGEQCWALIGPGSSKSAWRRVSPTAPSRRREAPWWGSRYYLLPRVMSWENILNIYRETFFRWWRNKK